MKDRDKKKDEEMLITHLPEAEPEQEIREPTPTIAELLAGASLEEMTARLQAAGPAERAEILLEIQRRFGNEAAERAVTGARGDVAPEPGAEGEDG